MPFGELPSTVRVYLAETLRCDADELPIIVHYRSRDDWTALTTHRLVARRGFGTTSIEWSEFVDFKVDLNAVKDLHNPKQALNTLTVIARGGKTVPISTDPGPPFLAFWNSLIMAKRMAAEEERRREQRSEGN